MLSCMQPLRRFLMLHKNYFDGSSFNTPTAANMLSSVFLIRYPFGSLVGVICLKNYKLWITMILAGALNTVGVLCRYIVALSQYGALSYSFSSDSVYRHWRSPLSSICPLRLRPSGSQPERGTWRLHWGHYSILLDWLLEKYYQLFW